MLSGARRNLSRGGAELLSESITARLAQLEPSSFFEVRLITKFMPTAIVLLKTDRKRVTGIAEKLLELPDISEVYSISGRYDLLVVLKCEALDKIESVITDQLLRTDGILDSETMFAFRSYDKREGGKAIDVD
jgi:DNA-binding Lrp family transcriptional regulator